MSSGVVVVSYSSKCICSVHYVMGRSWEVSKKRTSLDFGPGEMKLDFVKKFLSIEQKSFGDLESVLC